MKVEIKSGTYVVQADDEMCGQIRIEIRSITGGHSIPLSADEANYLGDGLKLMAGQNPNAR